VYTFSFLLFSFVIISPDDTALFVFTESDLTSFVEMWNRQSFSNHSG
jgi:hypothetical protein